MHRSRMWLALAVALGSLVATPSALAGDGARLAVSKLSSPPAGATADRAYELRGTVANRGRRTARGPVAVWLLRAGTHPRVAGTTSVSVTPQRTAHYRVALRVPSGLSAGTYSVVACIKRRGHTGPLGCATGEHGLGLGGAASIRAANAPKKPTPAKPGRGCSSGARTLSHFGDHAYPDTGKGGYTSVHAGLWK
jgi:hypothetical protein